ncbi:MAG: hypothetical protein WC891_03975 [Actinomycetota bacterium]
MKALAKVIHYVARTLAILLAGMLSVFILEGFDPAFGWQSGVAHAILAAIAVTLAILAHTRPKMGGWLYIGLALGLLALMLLTSPMARSGTAQFIQLLLTISPIVLFICSIGVLFLLDARWTGKEKEIIED